MDFPSTTTQMQNLLYIIGVIISSNILAAGYFSMSRCFILEETPAGYVPVLLLYLNPQHII